MGVQSYTEIQLRSFLFPHPKQPTSNMKAFVAMFAAVAAAAAEPWGYGLYGHPLVYGKSAPCVNAANVPVPCAHLGKREADPQILLGGYAGLPYAGYGAALPYA